MVQNFTFSKLKNPISIIWVFLTWVILIFVLMLIIADMASIIATSNYYENLSLGFNNISTCSSIFQIFSAQTDLATNCIEKLKNNKVQPAVVGILELSMIPQSNWNKLIIRDSNHQVFFHLMLAPGSSTDNYDKLLQKYWNNQIISQIYANYTNFTYDNFEKYSLVFQQFVVILVGISVFLVFFIVVFVKWIKFRYRKKVANRCARRFFNTFKNNPRAVFNTILQIRFS